MCLLYDGMFHIQCIECDIVQRCPYMYPNDVTCVCMYVGSTAASITMQFDKIVLDFIITTCMYSHSMIMLMKETQDLPHTRLMTLR